MRKFAGHWSLFVVAILIGVSIAYWFVFRFLDGGMCVSEQPLSTTIELSLKEQKRPNKRTQGANAEQSATTPKNQSGSYSIAAIKTLNSNSQEPSAKEKARDDQPKPSAWMTKFLCETKVTDIAIALFTYFLFVVGWFQAHYLKRQLVATENSVQTASDEFAYVHRPVLTVRRIQARHSTEQRGINFVLANVGDLTATNISGNLNVRLVPFAERTKFEMESLPKYGNQWTDISVLINVEGRGYRANLMNNERAFIFYQSTELTDENWAHIANGTLILYFFGLINYDDTRGLRRETAFFRSYVPVSDEFIAKDDDPDYEHT